MFPHGNLAAAERQLSIKVEPLRAEIEEVEMDYGDKDDGGMNSSRPMIDNQDLERQRPG